MAQYTNNDLAEMIQAVSSDLSKYKDETSKELRKFRDFMIVQVDRQKRKSDNGGKREWLEVIKQLAVAITVALGIIGTVLQIVVRLLDK